MTGQTLALYNDVQASYDKLRALWLALMDRRTKAEGAFELERPLGVSRFKEVAELLAGREDTTQLQPQFQQCSDQLDRLNQAHEAAEQAQQQVEAALQELAGQIQRLSEVRLPIEPLEQEIARERQMLQQAIESLRSDPIAVRNTLEGIHQRLNQSSIACQQRLKCVDHWRDVERHIAEVAQRSLTLRASGLKLREESADPDPVLEESRRHLADAWSALESADTAAAESSVELAHQRAVEAHQRIEQHLADKEFCLQELPKLRGNLAELRRLEDIAKSHRSELAAHFHAESWAGVSENVTQAETLVAMIARAIDEAVQDAAEETQRFSQAAQQMRQAETQRHQATALLEAVSRCLEELLRQGSQADQRRAEITESARRIADYFQQHERIVGAEAQRTWSHAREAIEQAESGSQQDRPHWPQVLAAWQVAASSLSTASEQAQVDVRHHDQLMRELNQVRTRAANVGQLLRSHTADRPRANQRYQGALQAIEQLGQASTHPNADWSDLLAQLQQAAADVTQAQRWAEEDIRLAEQAASALRSAEAEIQRSRTFVTFGVAAQMGMAESQFAQARQRLQAQDYEQAIAQADSAERAARQAHLEAVREAEERRRRQEEERRRREVQQMAASAAALASAASHRSAASTFSSPSSPSSSTSTSNWSSGTSQSSW
jgi:chromosome segregation ATPase